jgi:hypothetical protein
MTIIAVIALLMPHILKGDCSLSVEARFRLRTSGCLCWREAHQRLGYEEVWYNQVHSSM